MRTPPLIAIEALLAAAETGSFSLAAERLAISASALSRRIQSLESALGRPLFVRGPGSALALTAAGRQYLQAVHGPLRAIADAGLALQGQTQAPVLRLMASHSLATGWLAPRLGQLGDLLGGCEIELLIGRTPAELLRCGADLGLLAGPLENAHATELATRPLVELTAVPVAAPPLAQAFAGSSEVLVPQVLGSRRLAVREPGDLWPHWARAAGWRGEVAPSASSFATLMLLFEACAAGRGLALGLALHAEHLLREGRLQRLPLPAVALGRHYLMAQPAQLPAARRPHVRRLGDWLEAEAARSAAVFAAS
ncbi:LysR family transcriptional regulator [Ideonella azotifigens]|uniref:LysR family transcriptional regulator n=1 Tax=Ideonella azotifigens TaxID=513160 RepID=UPI001E3D594A|nr:LysR family transcriptional regulator [Ideonella azotifigens]MCD2344595.1 LysR family transcriptional regulator [Ideonella azotifigens]